MGFIAFIGRLRFEFLNHIAIGKAEGRYLALTPYRDIKALGKGIGYRYPNAVQTAGEGIRPAAAFFKLATCMQLGKDNLHHGQLFGGVHAYRNASTIILNADAAIGMQSHHDLLTKAAQSLIGCVIQHFLDDVEGVIRPGIHSRALTDGLKSFENLNR